MRVLITTDAQAAKIVAAGEAEYFDKPTVNGAPQASPVPAAPPAALPPVTYHDLRGERVDDVVPSGTPGTVTMPATGHVLSVPDPQGEGFTSYCRRVYLQCGGNEAAREGTGMLAFGGVSALFSLLGTTAAQDGSNWAIGADFFYDRNMGTKRYMTDAQKAAEANASKQWADVGARIGQGVGSKADPKPVVVEHGKPVEGETDLTPR